ncbi:MAG: GspE/PulE family protein [Candidatus Brocadiaceae bacterium]
MKTPIYQIEDALLNIGLITREQLNNANDIRKRDSIRLEDALVKLGYATYSEIFHCLASYYDSTLVDLDKMDVPQGVIDLLPAQFVKKHNILPISKVNNVITVAVGGPPDLALIDNVRFMLNSDIKYVLALPESLRNAIRKYYDKEYTESVDVLLRELTIFKPPGAEEGIEAFETQFGESISIEDEGPVIQLVSLIINKAVASRASDIHIEPMSNRLRVRYRIDGVCHEAHVLPKRLQDPIISRIKILSNMDISEKRRPQDGRISIKYEGKELDIRVSALNSIYGESLVMRLLEKSMAMKSLKNLGFYENDYARFQSIIKRPNGILLLTGPTGSGKTTTLYAAIHELNKTDTKIITAEDPVEYTIPGINQSEINEKSGFNFPTVLRTMLRQDPNIILVGEIRDAETADTAIAAALTGHLVLSTLHTNDAPSAITRLIDMGIKSFLVATSLQGVMAQRLVRTLCIHCKEPINYDPQQLIEMGFEIDALTDFTFYKGKGCKNCNNIGYFGRMGVYELLDMNETLRDMIYRMAENDEIRKAARSFGMTTLKEDGLKKARDGKTTVEEVFRIVGVED